MAFINTKKRVEICKKDGKVIELLYVTEFGPAEGFNGFLAFYREDTEMPFFVIANDQIVSLVLEDHVNHTGVANADS